MFPISDIMKMRGVPKEVAEDIEDYCNQLREDDEYRWGDRDTLMAMAAAYAYQLAKKENK